MKKLQLILGAMTIGALTILSNPAQAQKNGGDGNTFDVGTMTVNVGVGVGNNYGNSFSTYGGYGTGLGTKVALERGMWQIGPGVLSLGIEAGASFSNGSYYLYTGSGYKSTLIAAAARSAYHFGWNVPNLDTYGGIPLGLGFRSYKDYNGNGDLVSKHSVTPIYGIFVGGTYYFSPNIGVNVEAGYDITNIQGGIIFKLN